MSKIDELLKNEKVEWKKLGDVCEIKRGRVISKKYLKQNPGEYPVYSSQTRNNGEIGKIKTYDFDGEYATWTTDGAYAGTVFYRNGKFSVTNICGIIKPNDKKELLVKFIVYWLQIEAKKHVKGGSGNPKLMSNVVNNIKIPIPSFETQEKIVEILDKFTNYVTELQAELQDRTKQYEYYRDMLLSEDYLNKLCKNPEINSYKLRFTTLGEVGKFINGSGMPKTMFTSDGEVGAIHYGHIYTKYSVFVNEPIVKVSKNDAEKLKKVNKGDLVIARTSENIDDVMKTVAYLGNSQVVAGGHTAIFKHRENPKYLSHLFNGCSSFLKQKIKYARGVKVIEISTEEMKKIKVILPPLEIQNKVVEVLDKFQALLTDTEGLLPQEIDQRQKQYEYFREKLLTFDGNVVSKQASKQASKIISNRYFDLLEEACDIVGIELFNVEWKSLEEVSTGKLQYGSGASAVEYDGKTRYIRITDIDEMGNLKLEKVSPNKIEDKYYLSYGDILFARSGATVGKNFIYTEDYPAVFAGYLIRLKVNKKLVNPKFVYSCLNTTSYKSFILNKKSNSSKPNINAKQYSEFKIPVPPFAVQEHVVSILDKFDELINDISTGIPKEIELRQKEYEYYRERLLSFPR
ncbi:MAG: restriction endonuclease subunit S [Finegoldia magna]|nr:restriction endonuclease subunit S [Finegoldia magna]MDU5201246.1 restriction endonuclease subunit S [Finegoldia magna]MDU6776064.1 restriction endonuclease subunit S [Finegoldia magna]